MVARNPIISQLIVTAVESELTARGPARSADNPDIRSPLWLRQAWIFRLWDPLGM
jgi:hypothetical protein